jgi:hypothetical protein
MFKRKAAIYIWRLNTIGQTYFVHTTKLLNTFTSYFSYKTS